MTPLNFFKSTSTKSTPTKGKVFIHLVVNFLIASFLILGSIYFFYLYNFVKNYGNSSIWYYMEIPFYVPSVTTSVVCIVIFVFLLPFIDHTLRGFENIFLDYVHHKNSKYLILICLILFLLFLFI